MGFKFEIAKYTKLRVNMSSPRSFVTPLRYPGGKARLGEWLGSLMRHNGISGGSYVEPYAGGAGAAIYLLTHGYVNNIIINDADPAIYAFWWSILNDDKFFFDLFEKTEINMESWYQQKNIVNNPDEHSITELGFATFFLNRTNRSGIISAGVIGGKKQEGKYKIDARYNKEKLLKRIKSINSLKNHITVYNLDALELVTKKLHEENSKCLVYLDPPYYVKGSQLYRNHYQPEDHAKIADTVRKIRHPWLVTYDNCDPIRALYSQERNVEFSLHYSTHLSRPNATEIMFYDNLTLHNSPTLRR
tara:strand:- start:228 stop:1136 length:909 start_codon:yes stop_codon:yes gene_type:complete